MFMKYGKLDNFADWFRQKLIFNFVSVGLQTTLYRGTETCEKRLVLACGITYVKTIEINNNNEQQ